MVHSHRRFELVVDSLVRDLYASHATYHAGDSGLDLFVKEDLVIHPGETVLVDTGVRAQCKQFTWCIWKWLRGEFYVYHSYWLVPRSSISKTPLVCHNSLGLVDSGYRGPIKIALRNTSYESFEIKAGERYAQLVNGDLSAVHFKLVDQLQDTTRGSGGFGSTGK